MNSAPLCQERIQRAFFEYGWLTPVVLPLAQVGGRTLFDVLAYSYIIGGLISLYGKPIRLDRGFVLLYMALLGAFFLGVPGAEDTGLAFKAWLVFLARSLVAVFTLVALQQTSANLERLQHALGIFALALLLVLYIQLGYFMHNEGLDPERQLKEDNLPFLLPFLLFWVWYIVDARWRHAAVITLGIAVFAYVVISGGRAAMFGLLVVMTVFGLTVLNWKLYRVGPTILAMLVLSITINTVSFTRTVDQHSGWVYAIDAFTSGRTVLWRQALEHPPPRPLVGVGMGNVRYAEEVLTMGDERVYHLHNFILDTWYETGLLGVGLLLALLGYVFVRLAGAWSYLSPPTRQRAGLFLSASLAIIIAACVSFSYASRQFNIYLFLCLAVLLHLSALPPLEAKHKDA